MSNENIGKLYNFSVLFTYAKINEEKNEIITAACQYTGLSKKDTYEILRNERSKIQSHHIGEIAKLSRDNNDLFIEKYKIKEQIPQDQLPGVFNIDMFGRLFTAQNFFEIIVQLIFSTIYFYLIWWFTKPVFNLGL